MNIAGLIGIIVFYILILVVGIWAVRKKKPAEEGGEETDEIILAGRSIGCFVGTFTMTGKPIIAFVVYQKKNLLYNFYYCFKQHDV